MDHGTGEASRPRPGGEASLAGRTVARVGFGAMQLPRLEGEPAAAVALVREAIALGVDHIDTARFYGDGFSNEVLRAAVRPGDEVLIASKVGADVVTGGRFRVGAAQRPEQLRAGVEANLATLGLERIPLVNLRRMDVGRAPRAGDDQIVDIDAQLEVMAALRDEGKIGAIGVSNVSEQNLRRAIPLGIACVQNAYSLVVRDDEPLLELCIAEGIAWVPFFPLGGGFPGMPSADDYPVVVGTALALGCTTAQLALAWLLHRAPNILLIPGTSNPLHLAENTAAGALRLDAETLAVLDAVAPPGR